MYSTKLVRDMPPISEVDCRCEGCEFTKSYRLPFSKAGVTRAIHKTLRILRTNNGGEYMSNKFKDFLQKQGVIHQVTVLYSPQQNGVSERKKQNGFGDGKINDSNVDEVKRHDDTFSNETHHDEVDIPKFDIEDTTDTNVLRTRPVVDVYESCNSVIEPESYMDSSKNSEWIDAMKAELEMKLVDLSKGKNAIGYSQVSGVDFKDTFALVAHHDTIKLLLAIAAQRNCKSHHLDVKYAFLNGELKEEIYVKQPKGFEVVGQEEKIYRLYKTLYGLKQAPRAWYVKIDAHQMNHYFRRSSIESTIYEAI
ncbi:retrovirus-related pol polyprotein from transposon TNT 1-94 [Tanacetum coccineum]